MPSVDHVGLQRTANAVQKSTLRWWVNSLLSQIIVG